MNIRVYPKRFLRKNMYLIGLLLLVHMLGVILSYYFDNEYVHKVANLIDFNKEQNIPTLYSSVALLFSSFLLFTITLRNKKFGLPYVYWLGLSFVFLFLSIDETAMIHENLANPTRTALGTSGLLYFAWVIPYGLASILFLLEYTKFLFDLPRKVMALFCASGSIFVLGAIGFESLSGWQFELYGSNSALYSIFYVCEELLEMLGVALFVYALLTYVADQDEGLTITIAKDAAAVS